MPTKRLRYGSVCSGIEAATVAWKPLGWKSQWFAEIDSFPSAVLKHHYPKTRNYGDFTKIGSDASAIDVLVGGTPCQSFSVAGLRGGMADERGNLALEFLKLADRTRPRWVVWENVPGVLSSVCHDAPDPLPPQNPVDLGCDGAEVETEDEYDSEELHAFNCFLAGLAELGYGFAYRILDAQHFGIPQRRRRVFVVGYLGDWRRAAAVLFERQSLSGDSPPRRKTGESVTYDVAPGLTASGRGTERTGESRGQDCVIPILESGARTGKSTTDIRAGSGIGDPGDPMNTLQSGKQHGVFSSTGDGYWQNGAGTLRARTQESHEHLVASAQVVGPISANGGTDQKHGFGMGQQDWENGYCIPVAGMVDERSKSPGTGSISGITVDLRTGSNPVHSLSTSTGKISHCLNAGGMGRIDYETETLVTHSLRADGFDASEDGTGCGTPLVPVEVYMRDIGIFTCECGHESTVLGFWSNETEDWEPDWKPCPSCGEFRPGHVTYFDRMHETELVAFRASGQEGFTPSCICPPITATDGGGAGVPTIAFTCKDNGADAGDISPTLRAMEFDGSHANGGGQVAIAFNLRGREGGAMPEMSDLASMRSASGGSRSYVAASAVRRLTPTECEKLQGFEPGYTNVPYRGKPAADGPRYKTLGNSMAVPCMAFIGKRIQMVEDMA